MINANATISVMLGAKFNCAAFGLVYDESIFVDDALVSSMPGVSSPAPVNFDPSSICFYLSRVHFHYLSAWHSPEQKEIRLQEFGSVPASCGCGFCCYSCCCCCCCFCCF